MVQPGGPDAVVEAMRDSDFSPFGVESYAQQLIWRTEPDPADLRSRVATFAPDAVSVRNVISPPRRSPARIRGPFSKWVND